MPRTTSQNRHRDDFLRHSAGVLVCPRCGIPLQGGDHELGIAWRCRACGGQSLNFSQFRRLVPERGANKIWLEAMKNPCAPRIPTNCPECLAGMDAVRIPFHGRSVELNICRPCQRLWLDAQTEEAVPTLTGASRPPMLEMGSGPNMVDEEAILTVRIRRQKRQARRTRLRQAAGWLLYGMAAAGASWFIAWLFTDFFFSDLPAIEDIVRLRIALALGAICIVLKLLWKP